MVMPPEEKKKQYLDLETTKRFPSEKKIIKGES
jgi:hypothetical protein